MKRITLKSIREEQEEIEHNRVVEVLDSVDWNQTRAVELLGCHRMQLTRILSKYPDLQEMTRGKGRPRIKYNYPEVPGKYKGYIVVTKGRVSDDCSLSIVRGFNDKTKSYGIWYFDHNTGDFKDGFYTESNAKSSKEFIKRIEEKIDA